jgi:hypothetical protein
LLDVPSQIVVAARSGGLEGDIQLSVVGDQAKERNVRQDLRVARERHAIGRVGGTDPGVHCGERSPQPFEVVDIARWADVCIAGTQR